MRRKYTLKMDLNVLNHLGLNLYSNVPAVLAELIANAWDADASCVKVSIEGESEDKKLIVQDDGCGMDDEDLAEKFLTVGYQRRGNNKAQNSGDKTPGKQRPVMGRKGIGKLSAFSIAQKVQVVTRKKNASLIAIEMDVDKIREAIQEEADYHPFDIEPPKTIALEEPGTALILSKLKKRVNASLDQHLRQRVARRFSIISQDFEVFINGGKVKISDRNYFRKIEYALVYGDFDKSRFTHIDEEHVVKRANPLPEYAVRGWIGLVKESGDLQDGGDNLNKISILARGKVALEDILDSYREGGLYTKYIIGELEADFLDLTEQEDIATSSRQDFIQSDDRFIRLRKFVAKELKHLATERAKFKEKEGEKKILEIPLIKEWYGDLQGDTQRAAKKFFGKINQMAVDDNHRKTLYKHGVLAFEHLHHKERLSELERLDIDNLEVAVNLFSELDDIEASWYHQITEGRLEVIRALAKHLNTNVLEKIIQKYIYEHLWLLDPSWDRATQTPTLEQNVRTGFKKISDKLTDEEKRGRFDIQYKKTAGKHVIIELKRASVRITDNVLMEQVEKYIRALRKQVKANSEEGTAIEAICLVGEGLSNWETPEERQISERTMWVKNIRVITYQQLIKDAEVSYREYLDKKKDKGRLKSILDDIEEFEFSSP